jgi:hypothetical protein
MGKKKGERWVKPHPLTPSMEAALKPVAPALDILAGRRRAVANSAPVERLISILKSILFSISLPLEIDGLRSDGAISSPPFTLKSARVSFRSHEDWKPSGVDFEFRCLVELRSTSYTY